MALELHSDVQGNGPPLLILHGLFGSATNWRSVARHLASRHTVHALDLRNHGGSPWAATMTYPQMADDVRHYIARHRLQGVTVMGHSMGGKTAMALALTHPANINWLSTSPNEDRGTRMSTSPKRRPRPIGWPDMT